MFLCRGVPQRASCAQNAVATALIIVAFLSAFGLANTSADGESRRGSCAVLREQCWNTCGKPLFFTFRCLSNRDGGVLQCESNPNCTCTVGAELQTLLPAPPGYPVQTECRRRSCEDGEIRPFYVNGLTVNSPSWCTACALNCGSPNTTAACIAREGFCRASLACGAQDVCQPWRNWACAVGPAVAGYTIDAPCPTPSSSSAPPGSSFPPAESTTGTLGEGSTSVESTSAPNTDTAIVPESSSQPSTSNPPIFTHSPFYVLPNPPVTIETLSPVPLPTTPCPTNRPSASPSATPSLYPSSRPSLSPFAPTASPPVPFNSETVHNTDSHPILSNAGETGYATNDPGMSLDVPAETNSTSSDDDNEEEEMDVNGDEDDDLDNGNNNNSNDPNESGKDLSNTSGSGRTFPPVSSRTTVASLALFYLTFSACFGAF